MTGIKTCVSLYSLQDEYLRGRMSLDDIMHFVKEQGAEGVEILPDQMIPGAPYPSQETLEHWHQLVKDTGLKPVIADVFLNTNLYKNRTLTKKECIKLLVAEIRQAHDMGIHLIRLVSMVPYWVCEPLLAYCEKYDVAIAIEVHAGMAFDIPETKAFIDEMKRLDSPYIGIVVDTGIFCRKFPRVVRNYELNLGATPAMFDCLDELFESGSDLHRATRENGGKLPEAFAAAIQTDEDRIFAPLCDGYENYPYEVLDDLMPYIKHFHFKMFEMTEEGTEYSMDYKGLLQYLQKHAYDGYVATEYEGNRFTLPGKPVVEKQQVAAHQKYLRACLNEMEG